jgi:hypothetical protein
MEGRRSLLGEKPFDHARDDLVIFILVFGSIPVAGRLRISCLAISKVGGSTVLLITASLSGISSIPGSSS